jgi:hypothetical protein
MTRSQEIHALRLCVAIRAPLLVLRAALYDTK